MTIFKKSDVKKRRKSAKKSMKNRMFFESAIWEAFWKGFGRVLGGQNPWFSSFFRSKMQAKNEMDWRRRKNRILEPKKQTADSAPRIAQVRGKELKDGGSLGIGCQSLKRQSQASIWSMKGLMNEKKTEETYLTRKLTFGRRRMCYAQTAAPESKKKKQGNVKACLLHY